MSAVNWIFSDSPVAVGSRCTRMMFAGVVADWMCFLLLDAPVSDYTLVTMSCLLLSWFSCGAVSLSELLYGCFSYWAVSL